MNGVLGSGRIDDETLTMLHIGGSDAGKGLARGLAPSAKNVFDDMVHWVHDDGYKSPTLVDACASRASTALVLAIYESARTGQKVILP